MSKKKKKNRKTNVSSEALERARRELYGVSGPTSEDGEPADKPENRPAAPTRKVYGAGVSRARTISVEELAEEYNYVIADLRSMGVLAAILFVGMVVVSLLIDQL